MLLHGVRPSDEAVQLAVHLAARHLSAVPAQVGKVGVGSRLVRCPALLGRLQRLVEARQPPCRDCVLVVLLLYPAQQALYEAGLTDRANMPPSPTVRSFAC